MNKKSIIIIIVAGVVAIGVGIGIAVLVHRLTGGAGTNNQALKVVESREVMTEKAKVAWEAALVAMNDGNKEEAQKQLDIAYKYYKDLGDAAGVENVEAQFDVVKEMPDPVERTTVNTQ